MASTLKVGTKDPGVNYVDRTAVRAVLQNPVNKEIAIIHVNKGHYYKLPGGGIEVSEDHAIAVAREILEETGCKVSADIGTCLAKCEEYRNDLHQISYCYVTQLAEDTGCSELTELEASEGLSHSWVSVEGALELMRSFEPTSKLGNFIKDRDIFFVKKFAEMA